MEKIWYKPMQVGQWIEVEPPKHEGGPATFQCPFCGETEEFCYYNFFTNTYVRVPYCWNCGAYNVTEDECIPDDWMTANEIAVEVLRGINLDKLEGE